MRALLLVLLLCTGVSAQQAPDETLLRERERGELHPSSDPLVIVGLEQGGNDFRARTPALVASDHKAALVDAAQSRGRLLAMYEKGSSFRSPPRHVASVRLARPESEESSEEPEPVDEEYSVSRVGGWVFTLALGGAFAIGALLLCGSVISRRKQPGSPVRK